MSTTFLSPSIFSVRALNSNWDPQRGAGNSNFIYGIDAVAQTVATRIKLLQGEWWENQSLGTPLFQSFLGHPITTNGVALILQQVILGTPYVLSVQSLNVTYSSGRSFAFNAVILTQFGPMAIATGTPGSPLSWSQLTASQWATQVTSGSWPSLLP